MLFTLLYQLRLQNFCTWATDQWVEWQTQWAEIMFKIYV